MRLISILADKKNRVDKKIEEAISPDLNWFEHVKIYIDYVVECKLHDVTQPDYFNFEFFGKKNRLRRTFICRKEARIIYNLCNPPETLQITANKALFNRRCCKYLKRDWLSVPEASFEDFCAFISDKDRIFAKPTMGQGGVGAELISNVSCFEPKELFDKLVRDDAVIEEVIEQHPVMASLNPSSVNTVRIVTLRDAHDNIQVMAATVRIGRTGEVVDNFHHNGIVAALDVDTGIIVSSGIDYSHKRYYYHPDTGTQIVGFKIPNWKMIINTVKDAALLLPELRYIGWDIAINKNGDVAIVECNAHPGFYLLQTANQVGLWPKYKPIVEDLQQIKRKRG